MTLVERLREAYERYGLLQGKEAADYIERLEESAKEGMAYITALEQERDRLREALQGLHDDDADYLRLNHLGGYDNHWMVAARAALAATGDKHG